MNQLLPEPGLLPEYQPKRLTARLNKVAMGLVAAGALSLSLGLFVATGASGTEGSGDAVLRQAQDDRAASASAPRQSSPPRAPVDPTNTATVTPEPTATPEPPTPTPEPPTETPVPPRPTATPRSAVQPAAAGSAPQSAPQAPAPAPAVSLQAMEQELFNLHNVERNRAGLGALRLDPTLVAIARQRAQDMASKNYFAHTSPSGESTFGLMAAYGYAYSIAGENIAKNNYPDGQSAGTAMSGFMNSSTHRANILETRFTYIGVGLAFDSDGMKYFAVVFAGK